LATVVFLSYITMSIPVLGEETTQPDTAELKSQIAEMKKRIAELEKKVNQNQSNDHNQSSDGNLLQSAIAGVNFTGGISAGNFYTSNSGQESSDNAWLLSNLLVEISTKDKDAPVGFAAAIGETSTPSILSSPENNDSLDIEYASLRLRPVTELSVEVGLLQPNAGYENSYTFNNQNTFLGAIASQQPYNAYGAQIGYDFNGIHLRGGYYRDRLDSEEYVDNQSTPNESWELGVSGTVMDTSFSIYHYHLQSLRNMTGVVMERTINNVDLAFNMDYWRWDSSMKDIHEDNASIGAAFYIVPHFGKFSIPVRLEYIDQGKSSMYIESVSAHKIYAVTLSPTYHILDNAYVRADLAYVRAENGFTDDNGNLQDDRVCLAAEIGYTF